MRRQTIAAAVALAALTAISGAGTARADIDPGIPLPIARNNDHDFTITHQHDWLTIENATTEARLP
ncbi:hypothetical protein [Embleya scabrispora]|nr:hypothetical protein [Embleya scabrispora]